MSDQQPYHDFPAPVDLVYAKRALSDAEVAEIYKRGAMPGAPLDALRAALADAQAEKIAKWKRRVSVGDLLTERSEIARQYGWGDGTTCYDSVFVLGDVKVGRGVWIGPNALLDGSGGLEIGDHCQISAGVQIYSHDSWQRCVAMGEGEDRHAPTRLGRGVYVGPGSVIAMGVTIGDSVVVGAMSFVNRDVPSGTKVWGVPARVQRGGRKQ